MTRDNRKKCFVHFSENDKYVKINGIVYVRSWRRKLTPERVILLKNRRTEYMKKYRMKRQERLEHLLQIEKQYEKQSHSGFSKTYHPDTVSGQPENVTV